MDTSTKTNRNHDSGAKRGCGTLGFTLGDYKRTWGAFVFGSNWLVEYQQTNQFYMDHDN